MQTSSDYNTGYQSQSYQQGRNYQQGQIGNGNSYHRSRIVQDQSATRDTYRHRTSAPARSRTPIVQERIIPTRQVNVQPIVSREVIIPEIHPVLLKTKEQVNMPPRVIQGPALPVEERQMLSRSQQIPDVFSNVRAAPPERYPERVIKTEAPPIVKERYLGKIVEEVLPVIERDVYVTTVVKQEKPIVERVFEAPRIAATVTKTVGHFDSGLRERIPETEWSKGSYNPKGNNPSEQSPRGLNYDQQLYTPMYDTGSRNDDNYFSGRNYQEQERAVYTENQ